MDLEGYLKKLLVRACRGHQGDREVCTNVVGHLVLTFLVGRGLSHDKALELAPRIAMNVVLSAQRAIAPYLDWLERTVLDELEGGLPSTANVHSWAHRCGLDHPPVLDVAFALRPCESFGGDFVRSYVGNDCAVLLLLGDASGHGFVAGLVSAVATSEIEKTTRVTFDPHKIAAAVETAVLSMGVAPAYLTLLHVLWDPQSQMVTFSNQGHNVHPLVVRNGSAFSVVVQGRPLGLGLTPDWETDQQPARPGDLIVVHSDGISEQESPDGEQYGQKRVIALLERCSDLPAAAVVQALLDDVRRFAAGATQSDDQSVVVIRIL